VIDQAGDPNLYSRTGEMETVIALGGAPAAVRALVGRDWHEVYTPGQRGWLPLARLRPGRHVSDPALLSRAQGCWLGQLIGDALGGQVEFRSAESIAREFPQGVRELSDRGHWRTFAGQATDDSELALMLARALVRDEHYDPARVAEAYVHWITSHPFDRGGTITAALSAGAAGGGDPAARLARVLAAASRESQANGSLMRISPLGIFGSADPVRAAALASDDSALTHPHPLCRDACRAYVRAVAELVARGGDGEAAWAYAMEEARRPSSDPGVAEMLDAARGGGPAEYYRQMGWVRIAFQNAFHQALHASSFEEGVVATVGCGGDTDTNAAIAGALLGAIHGRAAVPARWRHKLLACRPLREAGARRPRPMEFWPADAYELAERLVLAGRERLGV
jgi:ADP-ribosylglycohydrolase